MVKITIHLRPAFYSKTQTLSKLVELLSRCPGQVSNSRGAFDGLVMEFAIEGKVRPVGTLADYRDTTGETLYTIHLGDGVAIVESVENKFLIRSSTPTI